MAADGTGPRQRTGEPRGEVHAMWNAGTTPARMIEVISPAGFEEFFREFAEMTDASPVDFANGAKLAGRHQLPFSQPEWLADVIARYSPTPLTRAPSA